MISLHHYLEEVFGVGENRVLVLVYACYHSKHDGEYAYPGQIDLHGRLIEYYRIRFQQPCEYPKADYAE